MSELVKINAKDYGLEESKAKEISDMFQPMLKSMVELEKEYNGLIKNPVTKELCLEAKTLRLKFVKIRTGTAEIHRKLKAFYLLGGRFVDGWKNAQLMASDGIESKLMSIEKHFENLETERITKLQEKRAKELEKYEVDFVPDNLGEMQNEVWGNYLSGVKLNYQAKIDAEKKAEEERIQKEKENQLQGLRMVESGFVAEFIDDWNNTDFGKMDQKVYDGMLSDAKKKKADQVIKQEKIRKDNLRLQREAEQREKKRIADKKIQNDKINKIQDEKDRIAKELNDKKAGEKLAEINRLARIEADKKKGDKDKMIDLVAYLEKVKHFEFKSDSYKELQSDLVELIENWIPVIN